MRNSAQPGRNLSQWFLYQYNEIQSRRESVEFAKVGIQPAATPGEAFVILVAENYGTQIPSEEYL
jgi:hypothetical protein